MTIARIDASAQRLVELLWSRFVGEVGKTDRYLYDSKPTARWSTEPLTERVFADHVLGKKRVGVGQIGSTLFGVLDFDGKVKAADGKHVLDPERVEVAWANTRRVVEIFKSYGFTVLVEVSRSKGGWHVWLLCDPVDPPTVEETRRLLRGVLRIAGLPDDGNEGAGHPGVFPHPAGAKECGRTPFLPWSGFLKGEAGGLFVDVSDAQPLEQQDAVLDEADLVTRERIVAVLATMVEPAPSKTEAPISITTPNASSSHVGALEDPRAAGRDRHDVLRGEIMRLRSLVPIEEARVLAFALAEKYGLLAENRGGEVENLVAGAYLKPPVDITTEYQRSSDPDNSILEPATFRDISNPDVLKVPWLIEGLIPAAGLTIIAAHFKTGKTFLLYRLILDALFGKLALGSFPIPRSLKVQLWQFEMPLDVNLRRFNKLAKGMGIDPERIHEAEKSGQFQAFVQPDIALTDTRGLAVFHEHVTKFAPDLLLVDSLSEAFSGADFNDSKDVRRMLRQAFRPVTVAGRGTVALHHKRKAPQNGREGDGKASILGSQAFGAAARTIYTLDRVRDDGPEIKGRFVVSLSPQGGWDLETTGSVFVIADNETGTETTVDPAKSTSMKGKAFNTVSATELAAIKFAQLVAARMCLGRQSAIEAVRLSLKCGKTTADEGLTLAIERKWVLLAKVKGSKNNQKELRPGGNTDWEEEV